MDLNRLKGEIIAEFGTQDEFSKAINWHKSKVSRILRGKYIPNIEEAAEIARILGLSTSQYEQIFLREKSPIGDNQAIRGGRL